MMGWLQNVMCLGIKPVKFMVERFTEIDKNPIKKANKEAEKKTKRRGS